MSLIQIDALEEVGFRQPVVLRGAVERLDVLHSDERRGGVLAKLDGRLADRLSQYVDQTVAEQSRREVPITHDSRRTRQDQSSLGRCMQMKQFNTSNNGLPVCL